MLRSGIRLRQGAPAEAQGHSSPQEAPAVSGLALRTFCRSLTRLRGAECLREVLARLPAPLAEALGVGGLQPEAWCPIAWLIDLHQTAQRVTGSDLRLSRELGYEGTRDNLRGSHRFYVTNGDTSVVLRRAPQIFSLFFRGAGLLQVTPLGPSRGGAATGHAIARWTDTVAFTDSLWQEQLGSCEAALELSGARVQSLSFTTGGRSGSPITELEARWSTR